MPATKLTDEKSLKLQANAIRQSIIRMLAAAGSGHSAGPLGMADIFTALYFNVLRHDPAHPDWPDRDVVVLSNGHICPVQYAALAHAGYFPVDELETLRKLGSRLQGHPHRGALPGLETTSGPLGSGLSQASGMAAALKLDGRPNRVFCLTSDGEHDEGNTWEAALFAAKYKLSNLTQVVDRNYIQIDGTTEDVMPLGSLAEKYRAFGWNAIDLKNPHVFGEIFKALDAAKRETTRPTVIVAHTTPGKGVSFMQNHYAWHGKPPNKDEAAKALAELQAEREKIQRGEP